MTNPPPPRHFQEKLKKRRIANHVDAMIKWLEVHRDEIDSEDKVTVELHSKVGSRLSGQYTIYHAGGKSTKGDER